MLVKGLPEYSQAGFVMVLVIVTMTTKGQAALKDDYYNLSFSLFKGYNKVVRPVLYDYRVTNVQVTFALYSIVDMDEQAQRMKTNARLTIIWYDFYLSWNESNYADIRSILVPQSSVWLPDIVVNNTVTTQTQLGYNNLQVRINSEGRVEWQPTEMFETSCDMDVTYYPFDTQVCSIVFTSAMCTKEELFIEVSSKDPITMYGFSPDGIWEVVNTSTKDHRDTDEQETKSDIVFSLQLKRRPTFYILNIIVPIVLLAMTSSLVFALPAESGEKMSLSITVLLAFAVYLTLVTDAMPKTSVQVSVLMVYVILLIALTALSVILSVPLLRLHHRPSNKPLGKRSAKIIIFLRKLMCNREDQIQPETVKTNSSFQDNSIVSDKKQMNNPNPDVSCHNGQEAEGSVPSIRRSSDVIEVSGEMAAETLSTLLFFAFLLFVVLSTIVCIVVLLVGGSRQKESSRLT